MPSAISEEGRRVMQVPAGSRHWNGVLNRLWSRSRAMVRMPAALAIAAREATDADAFEISLLQTLTFGQRDEARLTEALRDRGMLRAEMVALSDGEIIGHLPIATLLRPPGWATLLPVAVRTDVSAHRNAILKEMLLAALKPLAEQGVAMLVTTGDAETYRDFGFNFGCAGWIKSPFPQGRTGFYPLDPDADLPVSETRLEYPLEILKA